MQPIRLTPAYKRNTHQSQARDAFEKDCWGGRFLASQVLLQDKRWTLLNYRTSSAACLHFSALALALATMADFLVREAELDSCESTSGY